MISILLFFSIVTTALALIPAGAHALELPHKIRLPGDEYLIVQKIYRGWNLVGWFEGISLILSFAVLYTIWNEPERIWCIIAVTSLLCMAIMFWFFTLPANKNTQNWTTLPENWRQLRLRWEYSHAVRAGCALLALVTLVVVALNV